MRGGVSGKKIPEKLHGLFFSVPRRNFLKTEGGWGAENLASNLGSEALWTDSF